MNGSINPQRTLIVPERVLELYYTGKLEYVDAHRLIVASCKGDVLTHWSTELIYAFDFVSAFNKETFPKLS